VVESVHAKDTVMETAAQEEGSTATITIETTTTTTTTTDPWMLFLYAARALATNEKYIQRLIKFLNFLGYEAWKEEKKKYHMRQDWQGLT
jgi:hypothetical protein